MPTIVYLIDDEPDFLDLLSSTVEQASLQYQSFEKASDFFCSVKAFPQNAILVLDLNMPDMDGIEVMRKLATMPNSPRVILISGHDVSVLHSAEKLGRAHNLDIIETLSKPISTNYIKSILMNHVSTTQSERRADRLPIENELSVMELREAIYSGQMVLYYQPQFDLISGQLISVEALVRWEHPTRGLIYPTRFISLAERSGMMPSLTQWVINQAVQQQKRWQLRQLDLRISVNISAVDITSLTLPEQLLSTKNETTKLTLEVTESNLMGELVTSLDILTRFRLKGIDLSIDDFGTGYSSLSLLHRVPFNELKVDQSFVSNMHKDEEAKAIVKTCILLGHELNMKVVAEGIDNEAQLELLKEFGCDIVQGFLFSKAVTAEEIEKMYFGRQELIHA